MVHCWSFLLSALLFPLCAISSCGVQAQLQVNTLVGINGASAFQCWTIDPPFTISTQAGTVGANIQSIGNTQGSTIVFFNETATTHAGLHTAPEPQWVLLLKGNGIITLPTTNATLELHAGAILIANDTKDVSMLGHNTQWSAGSVAVQLPFQGGVVPNHTVTNQGPCNDQPKGCV